MKPSVKTNATRMEAEFMSKPRNWLHGRGWVTDFVKAKEGDPDTLFLGKEVDEFVIVEVDNHEKPYFIQPNSTDFAEAMTAHKSGHEDEYMRDRITDFINRAEFKSVYVDGEEYKLLEIEESQAKQYYGMYLSSLDEAEGFIDAMNGPEEGWIKEYNRPVGA